MLRIAHRPAQHFYTSFLMESELYFVSFWRVSSIKSRKTKNKCAFKQEGMILHGGIPFLYIFTNSFQFPLKSLPSLKRERKSHIPREKSQTGNGHNRFQSRSPWTAPLKEGALSEFWDRAQLYTGQAGALRPAGSPLQGADDFRRFSICSNHHRGSYTSPALAIANYPFVDLPPGNTLRCKLFSLCKFIVHLFSKTNSYCIMKSITI